jgi:hypothetical protein
MTGARILQAQIGGLWQMSQNDNGNAVARRRHDIPGDSAIDQM